ncbi:MAG TPA: tyrosine-type recombinase/integrase [Acidimicrobiia bacterium]
MKQTKVRLNSNGDYWQARWIEPSGRKRARSLGNKEKVSEQEAMFECAKIEYNINHHSAFTHRGRASLKYIVDVWMEDRKANVAPITYEKYEAMAKQFVAELGATTQANLILPEDIIKVKNKLCKKYKANTAAKHFSILKSIFQRAYRMRLVDRNVCDVVSPPVDNVRVEHAYTSVEEMHEILEHERNPVRAAYFAVLRFAGTRKNEPFRMTWDHIRFDRRRIIVPGNEDGSVTTKKRRREIPMTQHVTPYLLKMHEVEKPGNRVPFALVNPDTVNFKLKQLIDKAGYGKHVTPQSLRVSCENDWLQLYPQAEVAAWLGHTTLTQMRYYHSANLPSSQRTMDVAADAQTGAQTDDKQAEKTLTNHQDCS